MFLDASSSSSFLDGEDEASTFPLVSTLCSDDSSSPLILGFLLSLSATSSFPVSHSRLAGFYFLETQQGMEIRMRETKPDIPCCGPKFILNMFASVGLVVFAGFTAGLTLGLMSLGLVDLEVLSKSGRPRDRTHASKILPVVKRQHLLLCTLLIANGLAMESLPIFLDSLLPSWAAILVSITLVLMFAEILPHAIIPHYGLKVGAAAAPLVHLLLWVFFPVAYPISKVLDWMLGKGHAVLLRRAELKTFVDFHSNEAGKGGDLTRNETTIIAGALELTERTAKDVKNLLAILPEDSIAVRKMMVGKIPRVSEDMPLYDILKEFQKGHSHMAVVYRDLSESNKPWTNAKEAENAENSAIREFTADQQVVGVITMEDVIEELLQEEILDETDEYVNIHNRIKINMNTSQEESLLPAGSCSSMRLR
nr:DUF21 domain-containing protein At1g47330 [Ipomoea batatas]